ncbi:MAG: hypothetical protein IT331_05215 [Anaerolineae bacterium]|nr:hypothetical protein [Anaerolineae bacterium]
MHTRIRTDIEKYALDRNNQVLWANVLWVLLTAAAVTIFVLGTLGLYNGLREPCVMLVGQARESCLTRHESLAELGIPPNLYALFLTAGAIVKVLPWIVVGILVFWRKSGELPGIFFSLALILVGATVIDEGLAAWALFYHPWLAPIVRIVQFAGLASLAVIYVFPDGVFVPAWTRWLALAWVLRTFGAVFFRGTLLDTGALPTPLNSITALFIASFLFSPGYRYYRVADAAQRQQIKWVAAGALIYGVVYLLRLLPTLNTGATVTPLQLGYAFLLPLSSLILAVCVGISMLRPRLFGREAQAKPQTTLDTLQTADDRLETSQEAIHPEMQGQGHLANERHETGDTAPNKGSGQKPKGKGRKKKDRKRQKR